MYILKIENNYKKNNAAHYLKVSIVILNLNITLIWSRNPDGGIRILSALEDDISISFICTPGLSVDCNFTTCY